MTPELVELIDKAIDAHGNVTQLAKSMGIAHTTVLFWKSGKTKRISGKVWANKVRPALAGFMTLFKQIGKLKVENDFLKKKCFQAFGTDEP